MEEKSFEQLLIEAVDEGLESLGESGKHMIFYHLDKSYSIKKHEIPKIPEAFAEGLEKIFGAGASVLEKLIVKSLYLKLGLKYEDVESRPFVDCVNHVKEADSAKGATENERVNRGSSKQGSPEPAQGQREMQGHNSTNLFR